MKIERDSWRKIAQWWSHDVNCVHGRGSIWVCPRASSTARTGVFVPVYMRFFISGNCPDFSQTLLWRARPGSPSHDFCQPDEQFFQLFKVFTNEMRYGKKESNWSQQICCAVLGLRSAERLNSVPEMQSLSWKDRWNYFPCKSTGFGSKPWSKGNTDVHVGFGLYGSDTANSAFPFSAPK